MSPPLSGTAGTQTAANPAQALRATRRSLADASDTQLLEVVRMVDNLAERGDADTLLLPLRPRLALLAPPRPLRLRRLLFLPAEPVMISLRKRGQDAALLPRTALAPLAALVEAARPQDIAAIAAQAEGGSTADAPLVARLGTALWPLAAAALREAAACPPPPNWAACGLPAEWFAPLADGLAAILSAAPHLQLPGQGSETTAADADALTRALAYDGAPPRGFAMFLALCLLRFPGQTAPHTALERLRASGRGKLAAAAIDAVLTRIDPASQPPGGLLHPNAAAALAQDVAVLDALLSDPGAGRRAADMLAELRRTTERRFAAAAREGIADSLAQLRRRAPDQAVTIADGDITGFETAARALRRFADAAQRLGAGTACERISAGLAQSTAATTALSEIERARLVEILCGADAAETQLLSAGGAAAMAFAPPAAASPQDHRADEPKPPSQARCG